MGLVCLRRRCRAVVHVGAIDLVGVDVTVNVVVTHNKQTINANRADAVVIVVIVVDVIVVENPPVVGKPELSC